MQFSPINAGSLIATNKVHDTVVILDSSSSPVTFKMYAGTTAEQAKSRAAAGTPVRVKRMLKGGRNTSIRHRVAQNVIVIELSQAGLDGVGATWAYEAAVGRNSVGGRVHGKGV